jgi:chemotaxis protein MotB
MAGQRYRSRKRFKPSPLNPGGWQIVYTGFVLIMLCFFIMLTSFSSLEESKITRFTKAFSTAVNIFDGGMSLEDGETLINSDALTVAKDDIMARLFHDVKQQSQQVGLDHIDIQRSRRGVILTLAGKLLFTSGEAKLSPAAYPLLEKIAQLIKGIHVPIEIEGHSDDHPIHTAAFASNWELSTARAVNVLRFLIETQQVDARQISAVGFSQYQPAVKNDSDDNRAKNRRVEIVFKTN